METRTRFAQIPCPIPEKGRGRGKPMSRFISAIILFTAVLVSLPGRGSLASEDPVRSDFAPGELTQLCQKAIDQAQAKLDAIAKQDPAGRTFDSTVLAFENATADLTDGTLPLSFMKYVSPDP